MDPLTKDKEALVDRRQQGIQSLETGLTVLTALAEAGRPLALGDLARAAGMAPAKAHRYLVSLLRAGMVERQAGTGSYDLGPTALALGLAAIGRLDPEGLAAAALADLRDRIDESTCIVTWANRGPTVISVEQAGRSIAVNVRAGSVLSPLQSASGRALVAWRRDPGGDPLVTAECAALGWSDDALAQLVATIRCEGVARVEGTQLPGVSALSAPVFDHTGRMRFALTALGPSAAFDTDPAGSTARMVVAAACDLSVRLGHREVRWPTTGR